MLIKQATLFILYLSVLFSVTAQTVNIDTLKAVAPHGRKYIFPKIIITNKNAVANLINRDLCKDFLDIDLKKVKKSIFENVWATDERATIISDIEFETSNYDNKVLSVSISAEGCGAYCETYTKYYNYDLQNGKNIRIEKLFAANGLKLIADSLFSFKAFAIKNKISEANIILKKGLERKSDSAYYGDMLDLYSLCAEEEQGNNYLKYASFTIYKNEIIFILERCSTHFNRNVDEIDEFKILFRVKDLKLLSEYGKKLLKK